MRKQFMVNFANTTREVEDYAVSLTGVKVLELQIVPDTSNSDVLASLTKFHIA